MKSYPGWHKLMQTRVSGDTIVPRVEDYQDGGMWDKICTSLTGIVFNILLMDRVFFLIDIHIVNAS